MKRDDQLYGAHSGIQKAIRRGDLNLAKTCFDLMWPEKVHQTWLKWRITVLVEEEMWWMVGELADFLYSKPEEEKEWRRFIYRLVFLLKAKDSGGLTAVAKTRDENPGIDNHPEIIAMREVLDAIDDGMDVAIAADDTFDKLISAREYTPYERRAMGLMKGRAHAGGMLGDRVCCIATMILIWNRGLNEEEIKDRMETDFKKFSKGAKKPIYVALPWYVFDMHTAKGKWALNILAKKMPRIPKDNLQGLWFHMESATINFGQIQYALVSEKPSAFDTIWWQINVRNRLTFGEMTAKQRVEWWREDIGKTIENLVKWCLSKDSSD